MAFRLRKNIYYKRICELKIKQSGISPDGIPFVELDNGRIFYGYPPTASQRHFYRYFLERKSKANLKEECINVASDIVIRYLGPESPDDYIKRGKFYDFSLGDTVVEVGAYVGYYAIRAAELVGETGRVIAIEAVDENLQLLIKNIEANSFRNIIIVPKAAWKSKGSLKFYRQTRQQASAIPTMISVKEEFNVPCDTVDNILKDLEIICADFVRIQVNGAEREVLLGMSETLAHYPKLLIAAIYEKDGQKSWTDIKPLLENSGYTIQVQGGSIFALNA